MGGLAWRTAGAEDSSGWAAAGWEGEGEGWEEAAAAGWEAPGQVATEVAEGETEAWVG